MPRLKDEHKHHDHVLEGLSSNMQAFTDELAVKFPKIRYTSGKRNASQKVGKFSDVSHHNTGNAVDIGAEHKDVYEYLYNTKEGLALLNKYNLGIIDETDPETMKKTGATGKHFHIGADSHYVKQAQQRFADISGGKIEEAYPLLKGKAIPFEIIDVNGNPGLVHVDPTTFKQEVDRAKNKDAAEQQMLTEEPEMKILEEKQQERQSFLEAMQQKQSLAVPYFDKEESDDDGGIVISEIEIPEATPQLPNLPDIFNFESPET